MKLQPELPPGRSSRKALAYTAEIQRLRAHGYSHAAIQRALHAAGVVVCLSTVQREARRPLSNRPAPEPRTMTPVPIHVQPAQTPIARPVQPPRAAPNPSPPAPLTRESLRNDPRSSREIADEFMKDYIANPLLNRSPR